MTPHEEWTRRSPYGLWIIRAVDDGLISKSYRASMVNAFAVAYDGEPFDSIRLAIENGTFDGEKFVYPRAVEAKICDALVSQKKISRIAANTLLGVFDTKKLEIHGDGPRVKASVYIEKKGDIAVTIDKNSLKVKLQKFILRLVTSLYVWSKEKVLEIALPLAFWLVVAIIGISIVGSLPDPPRMKSDDKIIPGLGITSSEYQRRQMCLMGSTC